jgi:hypothetical protein
VLGAALQVLGLVGLFNVLQPVIDAILMILAICIVAAALGVLGRARKVMTSLGS